MTWIKLVNRLVEVAGNNGHTAAVAALWLLNSLALARAFWPGRQSMHRSSDQQSACPALSSWSSGRRPPVPCVAKIERDEPRLVQADHFAEVVLPAPPDVDEENMVLPGELIGGGNDLPLVLRGEHGNGEQTQHRRGR